MGSRAQPVTLIRPTTGWPALDLAEFWDYRELLFFLALRDIKVRYKQTVLGASWAILQPVLTTVAFTLFFGYLGGLRTVVPGGKSYAVFTFAGLLPWQLFAYSLNAAGLSLVANQALITKIYCPRLVLPVAAMAPGLVDFSVSLLTLLAVMWYQGVPLEAWRLFSVPVFTLPAVIASLAIGLWLAILSAEYRDVRHTVPFLTQLWLLATPVAYPSTIVPAAWRGLYGLNPMATVVEAFRWATLGTDLPSRSMVLSSAAMTMVLLVGAIAYFRRTERLLADVI